MWWLQCLDLEKVLVKLKSGNILTELQYCEMKVLMKTLPRTDVEERLVCLIQWKSLELHRKFCSALHALVKARKVCAKEFADLDSPTSASRDAVIQHKRGEDGAREIEVRIG